MSSNLSDHYNTRSFNDRVDVRINVALRHSRKTIVSVEKQ
jgi:hypothetical protein